MAIIDYSTPAGKLRMRLGDISDLPFLPDSVYLSVYEDCNNNLSKATIYCGSMILAQLSYKTHRKMAQLEVFGGEAFEQFRQFLMLTIKDPSFMDVSPLPYSNSLAFSPILEFQADWNKNFRSGTEAQQLAFQGTLSANSNDLYGPVGLGSGWQVNADAYVPK